MKGVIYSTSFFIMIFVVFLNLSSYINFDHNRSVINNNFKKALNQTGYILKDNSMINEKDVLQTLLQELEESLPSSFDYKFELLGYHDEPLLLRVRITCFSKSSNLSFILEETLIEREIVDE